MLALFLLPKKRCYCAGKIAQTSFNVLSHKWQPFVVWGSKNKMLVFNNSSTYYGGGGFLTLFTHVVKRAEKEASSPSDIQQTQNRDPRSGESRKKILLRCLTQKRTSLEAFAENELLMSSRGPKG